MSTATKVSLEEYLSTTYRPDCDYIDGEVVERTVGEKNHARLQGKIYVALHQLEKSLGIWAAPELRVQVSSFRFRVPDIVVVHGPEPAEDYLTIPPFLCIEVLSEGDTLHNIQDRIDDYVKMGVPNIWVIDPTYRSAWISHDGSLEPVRDGVLRTSNPDIALTLAELFAN